MFEKPLKEIGGPALDPGLEPVKRDGGRIDASDW